MMESKIQLYSINNSGQSERIYKIPNESGYTLGILHQPLINSKDTLIVFCGGINAERCDVNRVAVKFARFMAKQGIAVYRFDHQGLGISYGNTWDMTLGTKINDILSIINNFRNQYGKVILLGFSDGARNALEVSQLTKKVYGLIFWNPVLVYNPISIGSNKPSFDKEVSKVLFPLQGIFLSSQFYRDVKKKEETIMDKWKRNDLKTLTIWGGEDIVSRNSKEKMQEHDGQNIVNCEISNANHLFTLESHILELFEISLNWIKGC